MAVCSLFISVRDVVGVSCALAARLNEGPDWRSIVPVSRFGSAVDVGAESEPPLDAPSQHAPQENSAKAGRFWPAAFHASHSIPAGIDRANIGEPEYDNSSPGASGGKPGGSNDLGVGLIERSEH